MFEPGALGETLGMTKTSQSPDYEAPDPNPPRGSDDRRGQVNPAENPAPRSPEPDKRAVRDGEEVISRVKPY